MRAKDLMIKYLSKQDYTIWRGNPVEAIRTNIRLGSVNDRIILFNSLRQCSLSFFVKYINEAGILTTSTDLTDEVVDSIRNLYPHIPDLIEDLNHEYGVLILSSQQTTKRVGTQLLMDQGGLIQIGMVGDSLNDYIGNDIALHYAVNNATTELKERADYIASSEITSGAVEILNGLAQNQQ